MRRDALGLGDCMMPDVYHIPCWRVLFGGLASKPFENNFAFQPAAIERLDNRSPTSREHVVPEKLTN